MKKLALITLISAATALTACSKPTTEAKPEKVENKAASQVAATSAPVATASTASADVAQDPAAVIRSDIAKFQALEAKQAKVAEPLAKQLEQVMQKQDKAAFVKLLPQLKALTNQNIADLQALDLQDATMQKIRTKIIEGSQIGLQIQDEMVKDKPDEAKFKALNEKAAKIQADIVTLQQEMQKKMADLGQKPEVKPASAPASAPAKK